MGTLASILGSVGELGESTANAKEELKQDAIKKVLADLHARQTESGLQTADVQRQHLKAMIAQMNANPDAKRISDMEAAIGRKLTDIEKQRLFGVAPKEMAGKVVTKLEQDSKSSTGWSYVSYDPMTGAEYSRQTDAPPQRGLIASETDTTDPLTGLTTVTKRKPIIAPGANSPAAAAGKPSAQPAQKSPAGPLATRKPGAATASTAPGAMRQLDESGHIPAGDAALQNRFVVETANELLDGKDMDKVKYSKLVPVASALARKYGWEQGRFNPREQVMLKETTAFIQRAMKDDSMKALDDGPLARMQLQQVLQNPDKEGLIGRTGSLFAAKKMTDSQKKFVQTYNQLVGTISGLSQLVRTGRATEATIERLKSELPNPTTTRDSRDAQERLQRIMDEINIAMQKGKFDAPGGGAQDPHALIQKILGGSR